METLAILVKKLILQMNAKLTINLILVLKDGVVLLKEQQTPITISGAVIGIIVLPTAVVPKK